MASPIPLVRFAHVTPFIAELERVGAHCTRHLRASGLPTLARDDLDAMVSVPLVYDFVERGRRAESLDDLGWRAGYGATPRSIGALGASFLPDGPCVTLYDALQRSFHTARVESTNIQLWMERRGPFVDIRYEPSLSPGTPGFLAAEQYMLGLLTTLIRTVLGDAWRPHVLFLRSPMPTGLEGTAELGGVRILGSTPWTALRLPHAFTLTTLASSGAGDLAGSARSEVAAFESLGAALVEALTPYLHGSAPNVELAARVAGRSVRTLQRELAAEGTSYSRLLDQTRLRIASRLLLETDVRLAEIAEHLGYSDPAHLTRSFRRWTGMTPSAYRASGPR